MRMGNWPTKVPRGLCGNSACQVSCWKSYHCGCSFRNQFPLFFTVKNGLLWKRLKTQVLLSLFVKVIGEGMSYCDRSYENAGRDQKRGKEGVLRRLDLDWCHCSLSPRALLFKHLLWWITELLDPTRDHLVCSLTLKQDWKSMPQFLLLKAL